MVSPNPKPSRKTGGRKLYRELTAEQRRKSRCLPSTGRPCLGRYRPRVPPAERSARSHLRERAAAGGLRLARTGRQGHADRDAGDA